MEFSTPQAGWILAEEPEVGITSNFYSQYTYNSTSEQWEWVCNYWFGEPPAEPHAGFWLDIQCINGDAKKRDVPLNNATVTIAESFDVPKDGIRYLRNPVGSSFSKVPSILVNERELLSIERVGIPGVKKLDSQPVKVTPLRRSVRKGR